jgi:hypothetical protein
MAGVTSENVIPVFVRGNSTDPRTRSIPGDNIPNRPSAQRPAAEPSTHNANNAGGFMNGGMHFTAGVGFFPSLLGLQFTFSNNQRDANRPLTPEEIQQINTSRFLMMLGMIVMFCLLFFWKIAVFKVLLYWINIYNMLCHV